MRPLALLASSLLVSPVLGQQFQRNTADVPTSAGDTEQVDFADVDLDGDWDAAFANGGDVGNQQNVLWINRGGLQGGVLGVFTNETAVRFPAILDSSRDIEFADYDGDGDPDVAIANHVAVANQPSRFWTNVGGAQAGAIGLYVDETSARWSGLGQPGSSIPPGQVWPAGGYLEHPNDIDFADFDADGDLDVAYAGTQAPAAGGNRVVMVLRNDGSSAGVLQLSQGQDVVTAQSPNIVLAAQMNTDAVTDIVALGQAAAFASGAPAYSANVLPSSAGRGNCPADLTGDGLVDGADLGTLLSVWGTGATGDLTGDGLVDGADLGTLLSVWGPCGVQ